MQSTRDAVAGLQKLWRSICYRMSWRSGRSRFDHVEEVAMLLHDQLYTEACGLEDMIFALFDEKSSVDYSRLLHTNAVEV